MPAVRGLALKVLRDPSGTREVVLEPHHKTMIGSARSAGVMLTGLGVAHAHARVEVSADLSTVLLEDLHSECGTQVNGAKVQRAWLKPGDCITIGDASLELVTTSRAPRANARAAHPPAAHGPEDGTHLTPLVCRHCGGPVPLCDATETRCPYCQAWVAIPPEYREIRAAQQESEADHRLIEAEYRELGRPAGKRLQAYARVEEAGFGAFWKAAPDIIGLGLYSGLLPLCVPVLLYPFYGLLQVFTPLLGVDLIDVLSPPVAFGLVGFLVYLLLAPPAALYDWGNAFVSVRERIQAGMAARPPSKPGGPALCRRCGAALAVPPNVLGVRCDYCRTDNLVGLPESWVSAVRSDEHKQHKELSYAIAEAREMKRRAKVRVARVLGLSLLIIPALALGGAWFTSRFLLAPGQLWPWHYYHPGNWRQDLEPRTMVPGISPSDGKPLALPELNPGASRVPHHLENVWWVPLRRGESLLLGTQTYQRRGESTPRVQVAIHARGDEVKLAWHDAGQGWLTTHFEAPWSGWFGVDVESARSDEPPTWMWAVERQTEDPALLQKWSADEQQFEQAMAAARAAAKRAEAEREVLAAAPEHLERARALIARHRFREAAAELRDVPDGSPLAAQRDTLSAQLGTGRLQDLIAAARRDLARRNGCNARDFQKQVLALDPATGHALARAVGAGLAESGFHHSTLVVHTGAAADPRYREAWPEAFRWFEQGDFERAEQAFDAASTSTANPGLREDAHVLARDVQSCAHLLSKSSGGTARSAFHVCTIVDVQGAPVTRARALIAKSEDAWALEHLAKGQTGDAQELLFAWDSHLTALEAEPDDPDANAYVQALEAAAPALAAEAREDSDRAEKTWLALALGLPKSNPLRDQALEELAKGCDR